MAQATNMPETRRFRGLTHRAYDGQQTIRWTHSYRRATSAAGWTEAQACQRAYLFCSEAMQNLVGMELLATSTFAALLQALQAMAADANESTDALRQLCNLRQQPGQDANEFLAEAQALAEVAEPKLDMLTRAKLLGLGLRQPVVLSHAGWAAVPVPKGASSSFHPLETQTAYLTQLVAASVECRTAGALAAQLLAEFPGVAEAMASHAAEAKWDLLSRLARLRTRKDVPPAYLVQDSYLIEHMAQRAREHARGSTKAGEVSARRAEKTRDDAQAEKKLASEQRQEQVAALQVHDDQKQRPGRAVRAEGPQPRCFACRQRGHIRATCPTEARAEEAKPRGAGDPAAGGQRRGPTTRRDAAESKGRDDQGPRHGRTQARPAEGRAAEVHVIQEIKEDGAGCVMVINDEMEYNDTPLRTGAARSYETQRPGGQTRAGATAATAPRERERTRPPDSHKATSQRRKTTTQRGGQRSTAQGQSKPHSPPTGRGNGNGPGARRTTGSKPRTTARWSDSGATSQRRGRAEDAAERDRQGNGSNLLCKHGTRGTARSRHWSAIDDDATAARQRPFATARRPHRIKSTQRDQARPREAALATRPQETVYNSTPQAPAVPKEDSTPHATGVQREAGEFTGLVQPRRQRGRPTTGATRRAPAAARETGSALATGEQALATIWEDDGDGAPLVDDDEGGAPATGHDHGAPAEGDDPGAYTRGARVAKSGRPEDQLDKVAATGHVGRTQVSTDRRESTLTRARRTMRRGTAAPARAAQARHDDNKGRAGHDRRPGNRDAAADSRLPTWPPTQSDKERIRHGRPSRPHPTWKRRATRRRPQPRRVQLGHQRQRLAQRPRAATRSAGGNAPWILHGAASPGVEEMLADTDQQAIKIEEDGETFTADPRDQQHEHQHEHPHDRGEAARPLEAPACDTGRASAHPGGTETLKERGIFTSGPPRGLDGNECGTPPEGSATKRHCIEDQQQRTTSGDGQERCMQVKTDKTDDDNMTRAWQRKEQQRSGPRRGLRSAHSSSMHRWWATAIRHLRAAQQTSMHNDGPSAAPLTQERGSRAQERSRAQGPADRTRTRARTMMGSAAEHAADRTPARSADNQPSRRWPWAHLGVGPQAQHHGPPAPGQLDGSNNRNHTQRAGRRNVDRAVNAAGADDRLGGPRQTPKGTKPRRSTIKGAPVALDAALDISLQEIKGCELQRKSDGVSATHLKTAPRATLRERGDVKPEGGLTRDEESGD